MTQRPTFFLSSTIYDFHDLRSAIKYALEARGCRVLASEFNDFAVDSGSHSYEACLKNIEEADYFVLLIGSRVGGWFHPADRVSITQQEYREAYRLHQEKGLKLVTLVRSEVWQAKEDRKALERHLGTLGLSEEQKTQIQAFPSKVLDDAAFISGFLEEVGRNKENKAAAERGEARPTGNWIYPFSTFEDVEAVLQPLTFTGRSVDEASYRTALQYELVELVRRLLPSLGKGPIDPRATVYVFFHDHPITTADLGGKIVVDAQRWGRLSVLSYRLRGVTIEPVVITDALTSSIFMVYDSDAKAFVPSPAYDLLSRLVDEIGMFNQASGRGTFAVVDANLPVRTGIRSGPIDIEAMPVSGLMNLCLRWHNVIAICEALARHLAGADLVEPELLPLTPIQDMQAGLDEETVSQAEARALMGL